MLCLQAALLQIKEPWLHGVGYNHAMVLTTRSRITPNRASKRSAPPLTVLTVGAFICEYSEPPTALCPMNKHKLSVLCIVLFLF